jgi:hypothetical protein
VELTRYERWYGRDEPPVERRELRAGPLVAELDGPDLRYVAVGGVEIVRRLFVGVRDRNWGTVPPTLSAAEVVEEDGGFAVRFHAHHVDGPLGVDFSWDGELVGAADGTLACSLDGVANAAFDYNRIGWCVLHPAELAGRPYRALSGGGWSSGALPTRIGPQLVVDGLPRPLFPAFTALELDLGDRRAVRFAFEGDEFETEDQRNWTDASFKTYSTPLALGFPHRAAPGGRIRQVVRIRADGGASPPVRPSRGRAEVELGDVVGLVPPVGLGASSLGRPLSAREARQLAALAPAHLRVDLDLAGGRWGEALARELGTASAIGCALELAVHDGLGLDELAAALSAAGAPIARVLAFRGDEPTSAATVERVRAALAGSIDGAPVFGGSNVLFTELNRHRPELGAPEGIAWPLNGTVHADDDTSVLETPAMHGETVRSARAFCGDLPLAVTPITFRQRFNPVATGPEPEPAPGELPPQVDCRQPSLAGAAWTLASAASLAGAAAASLTYFETIGRRGVVESDEGSAGLRFRSAPGTAFPLYHVLADLCGLHGAEVLAARSSAPLAVAALAARAGARTTLLVANLSPQPRQCRLPVSAGSVRRLDEETFERACTDPAAFRADAGPLDSPTVALGPFAFLRVDSPA